MAQLAVYGPLDEGNLRDDFGSHPMCTNSWQPLRFREGRLGNLQLVQARTQVQQQSGVKSGTNFAGKDEVIPIEVPHKQRAETNPCALRIGESADHEFLRRLALHLQPVRRAAVLVR